MSYMLAWFYWICFVLLGPTQNVLTVMVSNNLDNERFFEHMETLDKW